MNFSYLQQSIRKLENAKAAIARALGGTKTGDNYAAKIDKLIDDLIGELAINSKMID